MPDVAIMTADEFLAALKRLGFAVSNQPADLGLSEAARFFRTAPRAVRAWALEQAPVPKPVAICLRLMLKAKISRERAVELLGG